MARVPVTEQGTVNRMMMLLMSIMRLMMLLMTMLRLMMVNTMIIIVVMEIKQLN